MPREIHFTKELVYSSPADQHGDEMWYRTHFGLVREDAHRNLYIWREKEKWVRLWEEHGQLLLVTGKITEAGLPTAASGLATKTIYDGNVDYLLDKLKTYWWALLLPFLASLLLASVQAPNIWATGVFTLTLSVVVYCERPKSGFRELLISILWGLGGVTTLFLAISFLRTLLVLLLTAMGMCNSATYCQLDQIIKPFSENY